MCISDWRAGRFMRSTGRLVQPLAGTPVVIKSSQQRVGVIFGMDGTEAAGGNSANIVINGAIVGTFTLGTPVVKLTLATDGDLPTREITISTSIGTPVNVYVTEIFLTESFLQEGTDQWQRQLLGSLR